MNAINFLKVKLKHFNYGNKAVSEVVSTLLVIAIVVVAVAAILFWGIPFIENSKREAQYANSKDEFLILEDAINQLIQTGAGARKIAYISNTKDDSYVYIDESNTRMILWYSFNTSILNFTVDKDSLDSTTHKTSFDGDKYNFTVNVNEGEIHNVSIYWIRDAPMPYTSHGSAENDSTTLLPPDKCTINNRRTTDLYTGYPYNFTFNYTGVPPSDLASLQYKHYVYINNGSRPSITNWLDNPWAHYLFQIYTRHVRIDVQVRNSTNISEEKTFKFLFSQGEHVIVDRVNFNSTIIPRHQQYIGIQQNHPNYYIRTEKEIKGAVRIDLYNSSDNDYTLNGTLPAGRIWVFDLGSINHRMQYSQGTCTNIYQNGAVFSHFADSDKAILTNNPNFYENESKEVIGFRIIQIRYGEGGTAASGSGLFKVNLQTESNYLRDATPNLFNATRENISNFYVSVYGDNSAYWLDSLNKSYNFQDFAPNTLRYANEDIQLVLSSAIIKASIR